MFTHDSEKGKLTFSEEPNMVQHNWLNNSDKRFKTRIELVRFDIELDCSKQKQKVYK